MISFEDVYKITDTCANEMAFRKDQCEALYSIMVNRIPVGGTVAEVGVQYGRSLSIMGLVAKEKNIKVIGIDNWQEGVSDEARENIERIIREYELPVTIYNEDSLTAHKHFERNSIDLVHIDGNHHYDYVMADSKHYVPKVKKGGYILYHDFGHDSLPEVYKAVTDFMKSQPKILQIAQTYTLAIFQKQ